MKNLIIGLFVLGLTSLGFSQNTDSEVKKVKLERILVSDVNLNYLEKVQDRKLSPNVISLQNEASVFDVKELAEFDGRDVSFQVMFTSKKGFIIADYDRNGKIIKTFERYKEIEFPRDFFKAVLKQHPKSILLKVAYAVDYDEKTIKKTYKIQIMKDGKKRNLKIYAGNSNNALTMNSF